MQIFSSLLALLRLYNLCIVHIPQVTNFPDTNSLSSPSPNRWGGPHGALSRSAAANAKHSPPNLAHVTEAYIALHSGTNSYSPKPNAINRCPRESESAATASVTSYATIGQTVPLACKLPPVPLFGSEERIVLPLSREIKQCAQFQQQQQSPGKCSSNSSSNNRSPVRDRFSLS